MTGIRPAHMLSVGLLLCVCSTSLALPTSKPLGQLVHQAWTTKEGLPQNSIRAITQDREGYIWLATQEGLGRFDGKSIKVFTRNEIPHIDSEYIASATTGPDGFIWFGTSEGDLFYYDGHGFYPAPTPQSLTHQRILSIHADTNGTVWLGTDGDGLISLYRGSFKRYRNSVGLPAQRIRDVTRGPDGKLHVASEDEGLFVESDDGFVRYGDSKTKFAARSLAFTTTDALWVGTDSHGVKLYVNGKEVPLIQPEPLATASVWDVVEDREGNIWIATYGQGLFSYRSGKFERFTTRDNLTSNMLLSLFEDREGSLWVGTEGRGLNHYRDGLFTNLGLAQGLTHEIALGLLEDHQKRIWVATFGGGLNRFDDSGVKTWTTRDGLVKNAILPLHQASDGSIWLGTWGAGLQSLRNNTFTTYTTDQGLAHNKVRTITELRDGSTFVGTNHGASIMRDGHFETSPLTDALTDDKVMVLLQDPDGTIWVGTDRGIIRQSGGKIERFGRAQGLSGERVRDLYRDSLSNLWVTTSNSGLYGFRNDSFVKVASRANRLDDTIHSAIEDDLGNLWLGSHHGVFRAPINDLNQFLAGKVTDVPFIRYGPDDGMATQECNGSFQSPVLKAADGRLWFSTVRGIAIADPTRLNDLAPPPPITVDTIIADQIPRQVNERITLPPGTRKLEIQYTSPTFIKSKRVEFHYKLDGEDPDWHHVGTARTAHYGNLKPGPYTFRLRAESADGVWSELQNPVQFFVQPAYYQTTWFRITTLLGMITLVLLIVRTRENQLKERQAILEKTVESQTREIRSQKNEVDSLNRYITESVLNRYLPPDLVNELINGQMSMETPPQTMDITICFSDLCNFTELSEILGAKAIAEILNDYLSTMNEVIFEHGGTIDKFIGDAIMVIFGAPKSIPKDEQIERAANCARAMQEALEIFNEKWGEQNIPPLQMRMGIHHGPAIVGNFGSSQRSDYTCVGPTVNLASRIESACKPGEVYISKVVADELMLTGEPIGTFPLKGVENPQPLYRLD